MRSVQSAMIVLLLGFLVMPTVAQMNQGQMQPDATVQPGPQLRPGLPFSADVFVNGRFALRVPASAGGLSPMQRARRIADRLNQSFAEGASWQDARVARANGEWSVMLNNRIIATADVNSARAYRVSTGQLAARWARQSVVAMGGQPQLIAQQIMPAEVAVAGEQQEIGEPPTTPPGGPGALTWAATPTKTVPLLDAATGNEIGAVTIAGQRSSLNVADAVVMYTEPADSGTGYIMVPITGTSTTGTLTRANGVGIVGIPASLVQMDRIVTGADIPELTRERLTAVGNTIGNRLRDANLAVAAGTTVVPLYSTDTDEVVGAAYVVGNASQIGRVRTVLVTMDDDVATFRSVAVTPPFTGTPDTLGNVVVSGVVVWTEATPATPGTASPGIDEESMEEESLETNPNAPQTSTAPGTPGSNF